MAELASELELGSDESELVPPDLIASLLVELLSPGDGVTPGAIEEAGVEPVPEPVDGVVDTEPTPAAVDEESGMLPPTVPVFSPPPRFTVVPVPGSVGSPGAASISLRFVLTPAGLPPA